MKTDGKRILIGGGGSRLTATFHVFGLPEALCLVWGDIR